MKIGEIAKKYKISVRTIRYYEELGLLKSEREASNVRSFNNKEIERLELILLFKGMHFTLNEIKDILINKDAKDIFSLFKDKICEIDKEINRLSNEKQSVSTVLHMIKARGIEQINLKEFIKEQIYINKRNEGMINVETNNLGMCIEIGEKLIPLANKQENGSLIDEIKWMRKEMEKNFNYKFDLIRVRDNLKTLNEWEYRIIQDNTVLVQENVEEFNDDEKVQKIGESIKKNVMKNMEK